MNINIYTNIKTSIIIFGELIPIDFKTKVTLV